MLLREASPGSSRRGRGGRRRLRRRRRAPRRARARPRPISSSSTCACRRRHTDEGVRAALAIRARWPEVGILVLSQYVEERYASELIAGDVGGVGYLLKDRVADVREFMDSVREVGGGGTVLDPEVVSQLLARARRQDPLDRLTPRERTVLGLMAEGRSNAAIAAHAGGERRRGREAREQHLHQARPPAGAGGPSAGAGGAPVVGNVTAGRGAARAGRRGVAVGGSVGRCSRCSRWSASRCRSSASLAHGESSVVRHVPGVRRSTRSRCRPTAVPCASSVAETDRIGAASPWATGWSTTIATRVVGRRLVLDAECPWLAQWWCRADYTVRVPALGCGRGTQRRRSGPRRRGRRRRRHRRLIRAARARPTPVTGDHPTIEMPVRSMGSVVASPYRRPACSPRR